MGTRHDQYLTWANEAARHLRNQISDADIEQLIFTRRYWLVLSSPPEPHLANVIDMELDERSAALQEAHDALEAQYVRWSGDAAFVVPDTSVFIEHPDKLEDLDLATDLGIDAQPLLLLIPIIVIDELDGLKRSKDRYPRWRAAYTLAYLDRLLPDPTEIIRMRPAERPMKNNGAQRGEVHVEMIFDPPGHERLPIADDEIVDRALAVRDLAGRPVTVVTYDSGQATRARRVGLEVCHLAHQLEPDEPTRNSKARR
jgi:rRNA-processing protein FCF1